jgi:CheY-like chemotaxis protein
MHGGQNMSGKTVLVVEDDPLLRLNTVDMFETAGLRVAECDTADGALAYVHAHSNEIACIFTDVQLPGEANGIDLATTITAQWPHIAVMVTSGRVRLPLECPRTIRFVAKPWLPLEVLTFVQAAAGA